MFYSGKLLKSYQARTAPHAILPRTICGSPVRETAGGNPDEKPDWHRVQPGSAGGGQQPGGTGRTGLFQLQSRAGHPPYQFSSGAVKTATEYVGDRQDMVQHANRRRYHRGGSAADLRAMLWVGKHLLGAPTDPKPRSRSILTTAISRTADPPPGGTKEDALDGFVPVQIQHGWRGMSEGRGPAGGAGGRGRGGAGRPLNFGGDG